MILHELFRVVSLFFPATFHVISRKIDYLCDSVHPSLAEPHLSLNEPHLY